MKVGVALAGGGLKGVAYIGALKALEELGIKIDYLAGTSSGSMAGALYAMGYSYDEMRDIILNNYQSLTKIPKRPIMSSAGTYVTKKKLKIQGLIPGERVEEFIQNAADGKKLSMMSDFETPFAVATVDTISTKECIFMSRNYGLTSDNIDYIYDIQIGKAIRSSMAFPGIFTPCSFDKYNFIDGGTKDNLPVEVLKDMGAEVTIGLSFKLDEYDGKDKNILEILLRTVDIFSLKDVIAGQKAADVAIEIELPNASLMEIDDIDKSIKVGYETIMQNKQKILEMVNKNS